MKSKKVVLGVILFIVGLIGVASLLTMEIPITPEIETILEDQFSVEQIKLLSLINPIMMLLVAVVVGALLYRKVNLTVPLIEKIIHVPSTEERPTIILKYGVIAGVLSGVILSLVSLVFNPLLPAEFAELNESIKPTLAARFLYGGLTEEIIMRFGLMTFVVWGCSKIFSGTKPMVYWISIIITALIFAVSHFPVTFQAVENPSFALLAYVIIGNSTGGIIFGWLYWKKGLESAFIAHIFAHVVMVLV